MFIIQIKKHYNFFVLRLKLRKVKIVEIRETNSYLKINLAWFSSELLFLNIHTKILKYQNFGEKKMIPKKNKFDEGIIHITLYCRYGVPTFCIGMKEFYHTNSTRFGEIINFKYLYDENTKKWSLNSIHEKITFN